MPQLNFMATRYAARLHNMTSQQFVRWRVFGGGCGRLVGEVTRHHGDTWQDYDVTVNLWCQLAIAPLIVALNLYIFVRILVADRVLRTTFAPIAFQAIIDVICTGLFLIIHDVLYILYDGLALEEGGWVRLVYTSTTASYNINAFNTSAVLIHLALDRLLTVRFTFMSAKRHALIRNTSFVIIATLTLYCFGITVVHAWFVQTSFDQSYQTLDQLYRLFWIRMPSMYLMTYLYSAVIVVTVFLYSYIAILFHTQAKKKLGNLADARWRRNKQVTWLFFLSTLAYVLCWLPEVLHAFFWQWQNIPCLFTRYYNFKFGSGFGFFVDWVRELLFYVYSVVNPLLFICTQNNFHWAALRKDLSRRQHPHRPHRPHLTHGHGPQTSATKESPRFFSCLRGKRAATKDAKGECQVSAGSRAKVTGGAEGHPADEVYMHHVETPM